MKGVVLPEGLEKIGGFCFCGSAFEKLVLPASVREVGAGAYCNCGRLKNVRLNEGLEKLGAKEVVNGEEYEGMVF